MNSKRAPRNTEQEVRHNPLLGLLTTMGEGGSGILAQEAQGQQSFVNSDTLPRQMSPETKLALSEAGVKFHELVENDNLFQYVELPEGWKKVPTDHSMHSNLVDETGRKRAEIFYKAAFYDRRASISLV